MKNTCFLSGTLALICSCGLLTAQEEERKPEVRPEREVPREKLRDGDRERNPEREGDRRIALVEEAAQKLRAAGMPDEAERLMARVRAQREPQREPAPAARPNAELAEHVERLTHMVRELQEVVANLRREVAELKGDRSHGENRETRGQEERHDEADREKGEH